MQYRGFATTIIILGTATFLASGGLAFVTFLMGISQTTAETPYELAFTPAVLALIIIGELGIYLLILAGPNLQHRQITLAKKQLIVGFAFIFLCDVGFRLLETISFSL